MQFDSVIWDVINNQFCSFKAKIARERVFCQNPYNVSGLCLKRYQPCYPILWILQHWLLMASNLINNDTIILLVLARSPTAVMRLSGKKRAIATCSWRPQKELILQNTCGKRSSCLTITQKHSNSYRAIWSIFQNFLFTGTNKDWRRFIKCSYEWGNWNWEQSKLPRNRLISHECMRSLTVDDSSRRSKLCYIRCRPFACLHISMTQWKLHVNFAGQKLLQPTLK